MPVVSGVRVEGLNKILRDLQSLGVAVDDMKDVMAEIAAEGARLVVQYAPHGKTGALERSVRPNRAKSKAVVTAGGARKAAYAGKVNYQQGYSRGWHFMQRADAQLGPKAPEMLDAGVRRLIAERSMG
jgi:hypothetical protein